MSYRTIEIVWKPRTTSEWTAFTASRKEAARLWGDLVVRHHRIRRLNWRWPSKARWQQWAKGRYPGLSAQSTQQLMGEFCEAVDSCRQLRKNGQAEARYPWRRSRYHDVVYTNQDARIRDGRLVLPHGQSGTLRIRLPETVTLPGRLVEVRLSYGIARVICATPDEVRPQQTVIGVDLGVNTLLAATDGVTLTDVPVTVPTPESIVRAGEPVTTQFSVLDCPGATFAGVAVKAVMAGGLPTMTVTAAVEDPEALVAVRV